MSSNKFQRSRGAHPRPYSFTVSDAVSQVLNDGTEEEATLVERRTNTIALLTEKLHTAGLLNDADVLEILGSEWTVEE